MTNGTLLPGYNQESRVLGMNGSSFDLAGLLLVVNTYDIWERNGYNIATVSASRDWLVQNENLNTNYTITQSNNLNMRANLQPFTICS